MTRCVHVLLSQPAGARKKIKAAAFLTIILFIVFAGRVQRPAVHSTQPSWLGASPSRLTANCTIKRGIFLLKTKNCDFVTFAHRWSGTRNITDLCYECGCHRKMHRFEKEEMTQGSFCFVLVSLFQRPARWSTSNSSWLSVAFSSIQDG